MTNRRFYIILLLLSWITAAILYFCYRNKIAELKDTQSVIQSQTQQLTRFNDKLGTEHAQRISAVADLKTMKEYYGNLLDSVSKRVGVKKKQIIATATTGIKSKNEVVLQVDTVYWADSTRNYDFSYSDKWLQLTGQIGQEKKLNYSTYDSLILTTFNRKAKGKEYTYIDVYSLNPHTRITGINNILIKSEKVKHWAIGPLAGYGWNGARFAPFVGFGVSYILIKF